MPTIVSPVMCLLCITKGPSFVPFFLRSHPLLLRHSMELLCKKPLHSEDNTNSLGMKTSLIPKHLDCHPTLALSKNIVEMQRKGSFVIAEILSWRFQFEIWIRTEGGSFKTLTLVSVRSQKSLGPIQLVPATSVLSEGNGTCLFIYRGLQWIIATFTLSPIIPNLHNKPGGKARGRGGGPRRRRRRRSALFPGNRVGLSKHLSLRTLRPLFII